MTGRILIFVDRFRFTIYLLAFFLLVALQLLAFWPPDMVPHPHLPEPELYEDDSGIV